MTESPSNIELSLVTAAVVSSLGLVVIASCSKSVPNTAEVIAAAFGIGLGLITGLTAIVLSWRRMISLDALATAIVGLIPALQAILAFPWNSMSAKCTMRQAKALSQDLRKFQYLRIGLPCICEPDWPGCKATVYIRHEASMDSIEHRHAAWHGKVMGFNENAVKLIDKTNGTTHRWWFSVTQSKAAVDIVCHPESVMLSSQKEAIRALSLLSDIILIGDWILHHCAEDLQAALTTDTDFRDAIGATPGLIANSVIQQLFLPGWEPVHKDMGFHGSTRAQKYSLLFFMLVEKSHVFSRAANVCGLDIVRQIWINGDRVYYARNWLHNWGCII